MPCFNEDGCIEQTAKEVVEAFHSAGIDHELVLVDNGSTDRTGQTIDQLIADGLPIRKVEVPVNRGYSYGVLCGFRACTAPLIGYLCADGQVAAKDVVRTYRLLEGREERVLTKVRRRFREDSMKRKVISICYNGVMQILFGGLGAIDINGNPKFLSRANIERMDLQSHDWFLDPEIIIKAKALDMRVIEFDVEGLGRLSGQSNVHTGTIMEFLKNIFVYRFGSDLRNWRKGLEMGSAGAVNAARDDEAASNHPRSSR